MRLYKQKDIPKQHPNTPEGPPRASSASPDGRLPHRLKRAAEAVSKQIAGHKAMVSHFNESKPPRQPVMDYPLPFKRSNAVKGSVNPPVVPLKDGASKAPTSASDSKKYVAPSRSSSKSRSPPGPGLVTKQAAPSRAKNALTAFAVPSKSQSIPSQTCSPVQEAGTKSSASPVNCSPTAKNLVSVPLTSISKQDGFEVDEPLLPASCFQLLEEDPDLEDWSTDDVDSTSDFQTQITQIFSLGLGSQSTDDIVQHGEVAPPLATPGVTLAQMLEPMSALVENSYEPEINFASSLDQFETIPLHQTEYAAIDAPVIVLTPSVQPTSSSIFSVSPIVSPDIILHKSLPCQPPSSTDYEFVSYLGKGSFGAVLLGIHKQNRRSCAIKIISKAVAEEQDVIHAVLAEQRVMRQASGYPYLLGLLASFHDGDNFYLISVSCRSPHHGEVILTDLQEYCVSTLFEIHMPETDKKLACAELVSIFTCQAGSVLTLDLRHALSTTYIASVLSIGTLNWRMSWSRMMAILF